MPASTIAPPRVQARSETRRELDQRPGQDVGEDDVEAPATASGAFGDVDSRREAVLRGVLARRDQGLRIDVEGDRPTAAPSLSAASARMPDPQP